jgi:hypothetical protein
MKANIGSADRVVRFVAGFAILAAGYYFKSWWGLAGIPPLLTSIFRYCPAYVPLGMSTCPRRERVPEAPAGAPPK